METLMVDRLHKLADEFLVPTPDRMDERTPDNEPAGKPKPEYVPSPRQIREECGRIRENWSTREHWKRAGFQSGKPRYELTPLRVHCDAT